MLNKSFETQVFGKWILAGEHSVLRGSPALVFPLYSRSLKMVYQPKPDSFLSLKLTGDHGPELEVLVWSVLDKACELTQIKRADFSGELHLSSSIPIGAGLGASAALCVAVGRWFQSMGFIQKEEVYEFARSLENLFHGESSGVDIAVALSAQGLRFLRAGERLSLTPQWKPQWYVSYSGKRGITRECVSQVKAYIENHPEQGQALDQQMKQAVQMCEEALLMDQTQGQEKLIQGIEKAALVFKQWGLASGPIADHIEKLRTAGAVAVKPTGSGDGGYVLSLWKQKPPVELESILISCF